MAAVSLSRTKEVDERNFLKKDCETDSASCELAKPGKTLSKEKNHKIVEVCRAGALGINIWRCERKCGALWIYNYGWCVRRNKLVWKCSFL